MKIGKTYTKGSGVRCPQTEDKVSRGYAPGAFAFYSFTRQKEKGIFA